MAKAEASSPVARLARLFTATRAWRPLRLSHTYEREAFFVAAAGAAAYYAVALATFSPLDASTVAATHPPSPPLNLAGAVGADLSGWAYFTFGVVAWLLPLPLVATAVLVWRRSEAAVSRSRILGWALALSGLCALVAVERPVFPVKGFDLPAGGLVGNEIAALLLAYLGRVGGLIALATAVACAVLLVLRRSLLTPLVAAVAGRWTARRAEASATKKPLWWDRILHRSTEAAESADDEDEDDEDDATEAETVANAAAPAVRTEPAVAAPIPLIVEPEPAATPAQAREPDVFAGAPEEPFVDDEVDEVPHPASSVAPLAARPAPAAKPPQPRYAPPPLSVFRKTDPATSSALSAKEVEAVANLLVKTFEDFGVTGKVVGYQPGPVVTVYEYQPDAGIKQSKVLGLIDDLALALKVDSIFIHPVRGKSALGVQVPNAKREAVFFGDIVGTPAFRDAESPLTFGMGKTISGQPMCADLAAMPHLLAAGATGSGKSVAINSLLCSIIMKAKPEDVRMVLVDPKMLELSVYEGIPHLLMPVITEPTKASLALKWATFEMERRYKLMQQACVRNIAGFNEYWTRASETKRNELRHVTGDDELGPLPYILIVIDELADLMMTAPKDVEASIQRLAQKARASGIHMVLATQRPSVDIITGVIKANLPCRIAFQVVSKHDSRTILDLIGAEKLLGKGDLLLQRPGIGRLERIQGAFISDEEVLNLVAAVKETSRAHYDETIISWIDDEYQRQKETDKGGGDDAVAMDDDPKWEEAVQIARTHGVVSASFLQRHLKIGYNRAARIVEFMESKGMVDKAEGAKPRKWLGA